MGTAGPKADPTLCDHRPWQLKDEIASSEIAAQPGRDADTHWRRPTAAAGDAPHLHRVAELDQPID